MPKGLKLTSLVISARCLLRRFSTGPTPISATPPVYHRDILLPRARDLSAIVQLTLSSLLLVPD